MAYATVNDGIGVIVEVNSETDFAAKAPVFVEFVEEIAKAIELGNPADLDALKNINYPGTTKTVGEMIPEKVMAGRQTTDGGRIRGRCYRLAQRARRRLIGDDSEWERSSTCW